MWASNSGRVAKWYESDDSPGRRSRVVHERESQRFGSRARSSRTMRALPDTPRARDDDDGGARRELDAHRVWCPNCPGPSDRLLDTGPLGTAIGNRSTTMVGWPRSTSRSPLPRRSRPRRALAASPPSRRRATIRGPTGAWPGRGRDRRRLAGARRPARSHPDGVAPGSRGGPDGPRRPRRAPRCARSRTSFRDGVRHTAAATAAAAARGSAAAVTVRPITNRSAPLATASCGVAARAWSWRSEPARRMPGTTRLSRGASSRAV